MRIWRIALALTVLIFAIGCGDKAVQVTGGKKARRYVNVVSLSPGSTEIVGSKLNNLRLVGRTASCNYPANAPGIPVVMNGVKPNFEAIIAAKTEAVFYDPDLFTEADLAKLKEAKIVLAPIGGDTIDAFIRRLYEIAAEFSAETSMMEYIGSIERARAAAEGAAPESKPKVVILVPDQRGGHMIAGTKSLIADVVKSCGGDLVGPDSSRYELASPEALIGWNPDLIACTPKYDWISNDSRLQSLKAVKEFKTGQATIAQLNPDIVLRRGVRLEMLLNHLSSFISGKMKN